MSRCTFLVHPQIMGPPLCRLIPEGILGLVVDMYVYCHGRRTKSITSHSILPFTSLSICTRGALVPVQGLPHGPRPGIICQAPLSVTRTACIPRFRCLLSSASDCLLHRYQNLHESNSWRLGFAQQSPVEELLETDNFTLQQLLDEEDLIQECKQLNKKLVDL